MVSLSDVVAIFDMDGFLINKNAKSSYAKSWASSEWATRRRDHIFSTLK